MRCEESPKQLGGIHLHYLLPWLTAAWILSRSDWDNQFTTWSLKGQVAKRICLVLCIFPTCWDFQPTELGELDENGWTEVGAKVNCMCRYQARRVWKNIVSSLGGGYVSLRISRKDNRHCNTNELGSILCFRCLGNCTETRLWFKQGEYWLAQGTWG